jgi:alkylated DNA nucleotide flippase Atl1
MEIQADLIVDISKTMENFFRCSGKMLKPSPLTIVRLINEIPPKKLITTDLLRKELARRHQVQITCPYDTRMALREIANTPGQDVAWWRVLKANGELNPGFPGGTAGHAAHLAAEGFNIEPSGKKLRVSRYKDYLVQFEIEFAKE